MLFGLVIATNSFLTLCSIAFRALGVDQHPTYNGITDERLGSTVWPSVNNRRVPFDVREVFGDHSWEFKKTPLKKAAKRWCFIFKDEKMAVKAFVIGNVGDSLLHHSWLQWWVVMLPLVSVDRLAPLLSWPSWPCKVWLICLNMTDGTLRQSPSGFFFKGVASHQPFNLKYTAEFCQTHRQKCPFVHLEYV